MPKKRKIKNRILKGITILSAFLTAALVLFLIGWLLLY